MNKTKLLEKIIRVVMSWIKVVAIQLVIGIGLFFGLDYLYSNTRTPSVEFGFHILHKVFHHSMAESFDGFGQWGDNKYRVCTDMNGFKASCNQVESSRKSFDVAFIGDSFTEAVSMTYEDSFVGMFAENNPSLHVANLGVSSYSPTIYLAKVRWLLEHGYMFNHLYVFVDISDIQDESIYSTGVTGNVYGKESINSDSQLFLLKQFVTDNFKLFKLGCLKIKNLWSNEEAQAKHQSVFKMQRSEWTYEKNSSAYGVLGVDGSIKKATDKMIELYGLLEEHDISMSIGVYPWPAQLAEIEKVPTQINRQVEIWKSFCQQRCEKFVNLFPAYRGLISDHGLDVVYDQYFIDGDVHFNKMGNQLVFDEIKHVNK